MEMMYRKSKSEDCDSVFELLIQLWPNKSLSKEKITTVFARGIESSNDFLISAEYNGKVVGFGCMVTKNSFWQESYVGYITTLVVDEQLRGHGIGKRILNELTGEAKLRGCKRIELDSGFHREQAHRFYENIGFDKRAYLFSKEID